MKAALRLLPAVLFALLAGCSCWPAAQPHPATPATPRACVWRAVGVGGGGFVDGIMFHPTARNLMYARTDVGGACRWDDKSRQWVALTDWLNPAQNNFTGIESIALDPNDPAQLYLAAGTYSRNDAAILRSDDQGRTFQIAVVPFKMGGHEDGRHTGERLVVDPNNGAVLFFGSRREGLWKSADRPMVSGDPRVYGRVYPTTGGRGIICGEPAGGAP